MGNIVSIDGSPVQVVVKSDKPDEDINSIKNVLERFPGGDAANVVVIARMPDGGIYADCSLSHESAVFLMEQAKQMFLGSMHLDDD